MSEMNLLEITKNKIYSLSLSNIDISKKYIINTINPHSYILAKNDSIFSKALLTSNILLPDGSGIILATRILNNRKIKKIAGSDIHQYLLEQANAVKQKVFYLGASENTLQLICQKIQNEFPDIEVAVYSPPFKSEFSDEDTDKMIATINSFQPDILFVGMTAPKQEKWVYKNQNILNARIIASIGAVFDFYSGTVQRSGPIWIKLGLEWMPRLVKEPKRLWRRNFISTPLFLIDLSIEKLNMILLKKEL